MKRVAAIVLAGVAIWWLLFVQWRTFTLPRHPAAHQASKIGSDGAAVNSRNEQSRRAQATSSGIATRGGGVSGHVLDLVTGEGVAGVLVHCTSSQDGSATIETTTWDGVFNFDVAEGLYTLTVETPPESSALSQTWEPNSTTVTVRSGDVTPDVKLYLRPVVSYKGVVEDAEQRRVGQATVHLRGVTVGRPGANVPQQFVTDVRGEFAFSAPEGTMLEAEHPTFGRGRTQLDSGCVRRRRIVIRLSPETQLPAPGYITGRVVDVEGQAVAHPLVRARSTDMEVHPHGEARGTDDGRFRIDGLDPGEHAIWVVCTGCASSMRLAATGADVTLVVGGGGSIVGSVRNFVDGAAVRSFTITLSQRRGVAEIVVDEVSAVDPDGRFELHGIPPGDYDIVANARGYGPSLPLTVAVIADSSYSVVLQLVHGATIRGVVRDIGGSPIGGALVTLTRGLGRSESASVSLSSLTDGRGEFLLDGLQGGMHSVLVAAKDYDATIVSGLQVESGGNTEGIVVVLMRPPIGASFGVSLVGIGAKFKAVGNTLTIAEIVPGGGAAIADLMVGDAVLAVGGRSVAILGSSALDEIRGPEGSQVVLTVRRAGGIEQTVAVRRTPYRY